VMSADSLKLERLRSFRTDRKQTVLGAGPMSRTFVEVVISEANRIAKPILLIPSKRQIASEAEGGGYVENWSSGEFCQFVRERDIGGFVMLARDHSGPWQGNPSEGSTLESELARTELSLRDDIEHGFDIIHCDPSLALKRGASDSDVVNIAVNMAVQIKEISTAIGRTVGIEVGTDEQVEGVEHLSRTLNKAQYVYDAFQAHGLGSPLYYVAQTGTKVAGTRNIGIVESGLIPKRQVHPYSLLSGTASGLRKLGMGLKVHNGDYLSTELLRWHRRLGLDAMNVAPEFGVIESRFLVQMARKYRIEDELDAWAVEVMGEGNWRRWAEQRETVSSERAVELAGHYHFAGTQGKNLRSKLRTTMRDDGESFDQQLRATLLGALRRYLIAFGY